MLKLVVARNVLLQESNLFGFLAERDDDAFDVNGDEVLVRAGLFDETSPFCMSALMGLNHHHFKRLCYCPLILPSRSKGLTSLTTGVLMRS